MTQDRLAAAHVPESVRFATKPALARTMIERAIAQNVPFYWVAADSGYGVRDIEMALKRAAKGYVLGVNANHSFRSWGKPLAVNGTAEHIAEALPENAWRRLSAGEGTKGARLHDWAYLDLADLDADDFDATFAGVWTRGLLIRRNIADGGLAYFSTWCPVGTPLEKLVTVEGHPPVSGIVGRSKIVLRPPKMSSASTTTKPALGMAGSATSRW